MDAAGRKRGRAERLFSSESLTHYKDGGMALSGETAEGIVVFKFLLPEEETYF